MRSKLNILYLEDNKNDAGEIYFNTRIVRMTETLLYCARLYSNLKIDSTSIINIAIKYGGLKGRKLSAVGNRNLRTVRKTTENEVSASLRIPLNKIESTLVESVEELTEPLFTIFEYAQIPKGVYEEIVNNFVNGKVVKRYR